MRLPDFVLIGAAKSGTTTLHSWLRKQPDVFVSRPKEPNFFSDADRWRRGLGWYMALFDEASSDVMAGESSTAYTRASSSDVAAARLAEVIPTARLLYVVRQPIERLASDYRHHVRTAKITGRFSDVVTRPDNPLVGTSCYFSRLSPYIDRFPREHICVVRFEDLVADGGDGWDRVIDHLGLARRPPPTGARNVTAESPQASRVVGGLSSARRRMGAPAPPFWMSDLARRVTRPRPRDFEELLGQGEAGLPSAVTDHIWDDVARLEAWLDVGVLWRRGGR